MQTLGLSDSTPKTEGRVKNLFWPSIRNEVDVDYIGRQGFWVCFSVAVVTLAFNLFTGSILDGIFESVFFFLGGVGVRARSRFAAIAVFSAYLLSTLVLQRITGHGFGILRIIFLALLLANIRGTWLSAMWRASPTEPPPLPLDETILDKLSDRMPIYLWKKTKWILYVFAILENAALVFALFAPREWLK
jgi:hypothetical protein